MPCKNKCKCGLLFLRRHSSVLRSLPFSILAKKTDVNRYRSIIISCNPNPFDTPRGIGLVKISSWVHWYILVSVPAPPKNSILEEICFEARHALILTCYFHIDT